LLSNLLIVAFTHQSIDLSDVGQIVIAQADLEDKLKALRTDFQLQEVFYIGTCNRVELVMITAHPSSCLSLEVLLLNLNRSLDDDCAGRLKAGAKQYHGLTALEHLIKVSCSLESMVVGEKEILAQVRSSYDACRKMGVCGDQLRLIMDQVIKAAKEVYTHTSISQKPISIVSLAYRKLRSYKISLDARILIVGAGKTNSLLSKYLVKHGFTNFTVFSRTLDHARSLASALGGRAFELLELSSYQEGFDVLLLCTSSPEPVMPQELYRSLIGDDTSRKQVIDLSLPGDLDPAIVTAADSELSLSYIDMSSLQKLSRQNMENRYSELSGAEAIVKANLEEFKLLLQQRKVELAMREVPQKIKEIRERAIDTVFADDLSEMDEKSRKTLDKVLNYIEKKYISVPMVLAKEILVKA